MKAMSLRLRLFLVILLPLFLVAILLGWWRFEVAQRTSEELFDRTLLSAALAISRDVAISEGDALTPATRQVISDAGGGELFYHVTGPGGIYVTGYAYPPRPDTPVARDLPSYYFANYRGEEMRVLRMIETRAIGALSGDTVVTVWQRVSDRRAFARELAFRAVALIAGLMAALSLIIWFGVQIGLRPLNDLQSAIQQRSPDDLGPIRRPVPNEVSGIVATLNRLLVQDSIEAHQAFISDAAHQLRNPAAAILTLAETLPQLHDPAERARCESQLADAARKSARLSEQLLSLERLRYDASTAMEPFELNAVAEEVCRSFAARALSRDIEFDFVRGSDPLEVMGNPVLVGEALINILDNALKHGGAAMHGIRVSTSADDDSVMVLIMDDGVGIPQEQVGTAFRRFSQLQHGSGTGLGLAIVEQVMARHGGRVEHVPTDTGTGFCLRFPRVAQR
jgi:two-component system sensor histidine kinase TctE